MLAYGYDTVELFRDITVYVDRIFKGASPADLPVEHPRHWRVEVNLATARALGVAIPPALVARADRLIE